MNEHNTPSIQGKCFFMMNEDKRVLWRYMKSNEEILKTANYKNNVNYQNRAHRERLKQNLNTLYQLERLKEKIMRTPLNKIIDSLSTLHNITTKNTQRQCGLEGRDRRGADRHGEVVGVLSTESLSPILSLAFLQKPVGATVNMYFSDRRYLIIWRRPFNYLAAVT